MSGKPYFRCDGDDIILGGNCYFWNFVPKLDREGSSIDALSGKQTGSFVWIPSSNFYTIFNEVLFSVCIILFGSLVCNVFALTLLSNSERRNLNEAKLGYGRLIKLTHAQRRVNKICLFALSISDLGTERVNWTFHVLVQNCR